MGVNCEHAECRNCGLQHSADDRLCPEKISAVGLPAGAKVALRTSKELEEMAKATPATRGKQNRPKKFKLHFEVLIKRLTDTHPSIDRIKAIEICIQAGWDATTAIKHAESLALLRGTPPASSSQPSSAPAPSTIDQAMNDNPNNVAHV